MATTSNKKMIRIRLKAYDHQLIDKAAEKIVETAKRTDMGVDQVTVQNLDVVKVDPELNMIVVRGAIPGPKGGIVYIKSTVKKTVVKKGDAGISTNPQKASGRNPQKASARK